LSPLHLERVSKQFSKRKILRGINLELSVGQNVGLVGINGAGKSTLLKSLLNLTSIDGGQIRIFGIDHMQTNARARLSYLTEHFVAPYFATGRDYLHYVAKLHGVEFDPDLVSQECRSLELDEEALSRPASEYSKGMMQKLGLIGCLLAKRDLIVLDEPMSGLDPKARALFKRRLLQLKESRVTCLFSTHLLDDIVSVADKVAVLHHGGIKFFGTTDEFSRAFSGNSLEQSFLRCVEQDD